MTPVRTAAGINKAEEARMRNAQVRSTDALRRVLLVRLAGSLIFVAGSASRPCETEVQQHLI